MTEYQYSIQNDFPNQKVNTTSLLEEIRASSISVNCNRVDTTGDSVSVWFVSSISTEENTTLDSVISSHSGNPITNEPIEVKFSDIALDTDKNLKVARQPVVGSAKNFITHNFCDPCSWYKGSSTVSEKTISPKVEGVYDIYSMGDVNIIDIYHGRLTLENTVSSRSSYKPVVKVNDVTKTEDTDYTINYEDGEITFTNALTAQDVVKTSYKKANSSIFIISSISGKKLKIVHTEVQFSKNLKVQDSPIYFDAYGYDPNNLPNKMLYKRNEYNCAKDYLNEANIGYSIPGFGELTQDVLILPWNYPASKVLKYSEGAEIRISLKNDLPVKTLSNTKGEVATCTFYCLSEDE